MEKYNKWTGDISIKDQKTKLLTFVENSENEQAKNPRAFLIFDRGTKQANLHSDTKAFSFKLI